MAVEPPTFNPTHDLTCDVTIVGGGLVALALAHQLTQAGVKVILVATQGGTIASIRQGEFLAESDVRELRATATLLDLVTDLGLRERLVRARIRPLRYVWWRGKLQPFPDHWLSLVGTPLLSWTGKMRCLGEPLVARRAGGSDETITEFVERRFGEEVQRVLVHPFVGMIYGGDPGQLSAQATLPEWTELESAQGRVLSGFFRRTQRAFAAPVSFQGGLQELTDTLAKTLDEHIIWGREALSLQPTTGGYRVQLTNGQVVTATAVVLALPAHNSAPLLKTLDPPLSRKLASIYYPPLGVVALAYPQASLNHSLQGWGHLIPRGQGLNSLGALWSSSLFPDRAPPGWHLVTVVLGGALDPQIQDWDEDELIRAAHSDLQKVLKVSQEPRVIYCRRHNQAVPQFCLGYLDKVVQIQERLKQQPGLFLAHSYLTGGSLNEALSQAHLTGQAVQQFCQRERVISLTP